MRSLFDELVADGEVALTRLVEERQQETVQLDFKGKRTPQNGHWEKDDQKVFAKALSAFANSMGGVIIFGVDARKDADGIDAAVALQPISDLAVFASQAQTLVGQLLIPKHDGVVIEAIPSSQSPGSGYLAVLVERSNRRPHRSEAANDKHYYKRSGDNSFVMEHYDIEDAFNRVTPSELDVIWSAKEGVSIKMLGSNRTMVVSLIVSLSNTSRLTATMPYLHFVAITGANIDHYGLDGNRNHGLRHRAGEPTFFAGGADDAVHPGQTLPVTVLKVAMIETGDGSWTINGDPDLLLSFGCEFGCANSPLRSKHFDITAHQLQLALVSS